MIVKEAYCNCLVCGMFSHGSWSPRRCSFVDRASLNRMTRMYIAIILKQIRQSKEREHKNWYKHQDLRNRFHQDCPVASGTASRFRIMGVVIWYSSTASCRETSASESSTSQVGPSPSPSASEASKSALGSNKNSRTTTFQSSHPRLTTNCLAPCLLCCAGSTSYPSSRVFWRGSAIELG